MDHRKKNYKPEDLAILNCLTDGHWSEERLQLERERDEMVRQMAERNRMKRMLRRLAVSGVELH